MSILTTRMPLFFIGLGLLVIAVCLIAWACKRRLVRRGLELGRFYCRSCRYDNSLAIDYRCPECGAGLLPDGLLTRRTPVVLGTGGVYWGGLMIGFGSGGWLAFNTTLLGPWAPGWLSWVLLLAVAFGPTLACTYVIWRIQLSRNQQRWHDERIAFMQVVELNRESLGLDNAKDESARTESHSGQFGR